jgi:hypothetical protein
VTDEENRLSWLTDWQAASERPRRTLTMLFVTVTAGMSCIAYFGPADRAILASLIFGALTGALIAVMGYQRIIDARGGLERKIPAASFFDVLCGAVAIGLLVLALATTTWVLLVPALIFGAISASMLVLRARQQ